VHKFFEGLQPTLHIAHRGGAALAPENTLPAFRQAVEKYRTQMLELDVHLTRDGEVVVAHDHTLERCTDGSGPLSALSYSELTKLDAGYRFTLDGGETFPFRGQAVRIPRLVEVLRAFPQMKINVELKESDNGLETAFAELVRAEGAIDRICVGSESDALGEKICALLPQACSFYPREALTAFVLTVRSGEPPPVDERFHVLDMPLYFGGERLVDAALRDAATRAGKWINVWTIDDREEMKRLVAEGVGGIMTDRPDVLREVLSLPSGLHNLDGR
jgi:glycerophosphoryl diester phosphodiesterase